jgi:hypothetical protein
VEEFERCHYYRGYLLKCEPTRLESGRFIESAVVVHPDETGNTVVASSYRDAGFISRGAANRHAWGWAKKWVDDLLGG